MILVTCATGKTGKAIIKALVSAGRPVRAMARQESSKEIAKERNLKIPK